MLRRSCQVSTLFFPEDHGRHADFRTEWWYLSGQLHGNDGAEWAYHLTIFRRAFEKWMDLALVGMAIGCKSVRKTALFQRTLAKILENQNCRHISVDGYVGHLALTSVAERKYVFFERAATSLFNMAGAQDGGLGVWVKGWELREAEGTIHALAEREGFAIDLKLRPLKPPALHGNHGLSMKGAAAGQASFHYSLPSLQTTGTIDWHGENHHVDGVSWMDREFGTAMLPRSVRGWDWFGLHLHNNHEIMICLIRSLDGKIADTSSGTVILPDGSWECLAANNFYVEAVEFWVSPVTGARYPVRWVSRIDKMNLQMDICAVIKEHEMVSASSTTIDYWEGPVHVSGNMNGGSINGKGHVELVGYSQPAGGKF
jgi:predicted secreted hydrolase